jgi:penicillin-binding protein 1A
VFLFVLAAVFGSLSGLMLVYSVNLPQINDLERYRPSSMTDLYDRKGHLIGSIALEHRVDVGYNDFAPVLRQAVISIEDKNFESHWGINVFRIAGALVHDLRSHGRSQGASTLTMQLARNLFLSSERTYGRKIQEAFLAIQIERSFTKEQIFTLYGNQIYLGHGNYGFEAASEFYFSCHARDLTLTEAALLAGLPKGPVAYSPLLNPEKALRRRNLVLTEMESDHAITHAEAEAARRSPLGLHISQPEVPVAPWFVEEVRRELNQHFGADVVLESGLRVDTTLDLDLQRVANRAVLDGLAAYERRRGWRGAAVNVLAQGGDLESYKHPDWATHAMPGDYTHALVTRVLPLEIRARVGEQRIVMTPADWQWTGQTHGDALVKPGDVIYVHLSGAMEGNAERATLEQDSGAQGALMAMDNTTGEVLAMVGGRDYALSQFNRATQAERQTGSSFKPYVYTAAIESGITPEDTVMDSPVSFGSYHPHDYEKNYKGRMSVLEAFADSRNIPALRLADRVGIHTVIETAHRFGVTSTIPPYLPIALGAVEITLAEQMQSYAVFPNDGIRVQAHLVSSVTSADGIPLWQPTPAISQVISQQTARSMMLLLRAVTRTGTAAAAAALNHPVGGKTGTTSNFTDAWFLGFSPSVTCGVWVGFDSRQSLGDKETGARAALPIWASFMRAAIAEHPVESFPGDGSFPEKVAGSGTSPPSGSLTPGSGMPRPGMPRSGSPRPGSPGSGSPGSGSPGSGMPGPVTDRRLRRPGALPARNSAAPGGRRAQSAPAG